MSAGDRRNRCLSPISRRQQGFTYLALLIAVAVSGAVLASIGELASHGQQREKEAQLLFVGQQYRQAIAAYYERSPGGAKRYPQKLEDMLEDKRWPVIQRYLRRPYADPVTGKTQWGLVEAPGGGIMGVYSLSEEKPIKSGGFDQRDESFAEATKYAEWQFFYRPPAASASAGPPSGSAGNAAAPK
jgi:type II secretory pathway pseudopilin PulG